MKIEKFLLDFDQITPESFVADDEIDAYRKALDQKFRVDFIKSYTKTKQIDEKRKLKFPVVFTF